MSEQKAKLIWVNCPNPKCKQKGIQLQKYIVSEKMMCGYCGQTIEPTAAETRSIFSGTAKGSDG